MDSGAPSFVCLLVLDGWGIATPGAGNAITLAKTPNLDRLFTEYPHTSLQASGEAVGLPKGQMGNSEVGHLNLGAGRVVFQDLTRIDLAIADGSFFQNRELLHAFSHARENDSAVHLMGLLSDGGVHSDISHLKALVQMGKQQGCSRIFLHLFLDGRDVSPTSGVGYMLEITEFLGESGVGKVATVSGRYYAMDRDNRWERTKLAYDALVHGSGPRDMDPVGLIQKGYDEGITDEFMVPTVTSNRPESRVRDVDSVIFFNFRPDRSRQLTRSLIYAGFDSFDRGSDPPLPFLVSMTKYDAGFTAPIAFPLEKLENVLAVVLSKAGKSQLHIAETEKYAHVTFFFNGGVETINTGETRKLIPSPADVPTYDKKPEMSAREVTAELIHLLEKQHFDFIIVNLANCDMVGHTGDLTAAITAVEVVDDCVGWIVEKVTASGGVCLITSDHGNAESMQDSHGGPHTAHTTDRVPLIVTMPGVNLTDGCALCDVAPTILYLLNLPAPREITGHCIISGR